MIKIVGIAFILCLFTACNQKNREESFVVNFRSEGCYHSVSNMFVFKNNQVTVYEVLENEEDKKNLGTLLLTSTDKANLKKLFHYYDNYRASERACTTVDRVEIKHYKGTKLFSSKKVIDDSCDLSHHRNIKIDFYMFVERIKKSAKTF